MLKTIEFFRSIQQLVIDRDIGLNFFSLIRNALV